MNRVRIAVLLLGPVPIVAASLGLTHWWRPHGPSTIAGNHVLHAEEPRAGTTRPAATSNLAADLNNQLQAECESTAAKLKPRLGKECSVIVRSPYVVAGDMSEQDLRIWCEGTIEPATRALLRTYFNKSPSVPVTILLFGGEESYNRYGKQLFGTEGISVYGYYKSDQRTLVMNISTGGGTLVHEMTHALIDFDFPQVPDWFNEGLASLYEQCRFLPNEGGIEGLPNWRLPKLQEAIQQKRLISLERLISSDDFRGANVGINYAQARYFCLYLQEHKLLEKFYRQFHGARENDPRGLATAKALFPGKSWAEIDRDYQEWVATLVR